jgi:hypothetical protein
MVLSTSLSLKPLKSYIQSLSLRQLLQIPLPPLSSQKRIVQGECGICKFILGGIFKLLAAKQAFILQSHSEAHSGTGNSS